MGYLSGAAGATPPLEPDNRTEDGRPRGGRPDTSFVKEDASYMADNDDKREDSGAGGKKTLSLKGGPNMGARPNVARSSRNTVVVEKRTRFVPPG